MMFIFIFDHGNWGPNWGTRHLAPIDISPPWTPFPLGRLAPTYSYSYLVENLLFLGDPCIMAARMPCGSHKMIKWYEHWVITPFKMLKELLRSIDIFV